MGGGQGPLAPLDPRLVIQLYVLAAPEGGLRCRLDVKAPLKLKTYKSPKPASFQLTMLPLISLILLATLSHVTGSDEKIALLIIDVQTCFTSGGTLAVTDGDKVIDVINGIRDKYDSYFDTVVLSQDWHCPDHVSFASQHKGANIYDVIDLDYNAKGAHGKAYLSSCLCASKYTHHLIHNSLI